MADGLMSRYIGLCIQDMSSTYIVILIDTKQRDKHPLVLFTQTYVDCCSLSGPPKAAQLFHEWDHIQVNILRIMGY